MPVTTPVSEVSALPVPVVTVPPSRASVPLFVRTSRVSAPPMESVAPEAMVKPEALFCRTPLPDVASLPADTRVAPA